MDEGVTGRPGGQVEGCGLQWGMEGKRGRLGGGPGRTPVSSTWTKLGWKENQGLGAVHTQVGAGTLGSGEPPALGRPLRETVLGSSGPQ